MTYNKPSDITSSHNTSTREYPEKSSPPQLMIKITSIQCLNSTYPSTFQEPLKTIQADLSNMSSKGPLHHPKGHFEALTNLKYSFWAKIKIIASQHLEKAKSLMENGIQESIENFWLKEKPLLEIWEERINSLSLNLNLFNSKIITLERKVNDQDDSSKSLEFDLKSFTEIYKNSKKFSTKLTDSSLSNIPPTCSFLTCKKDRKIISDWMILFTNK